MGTDAAELGIGNSSRLDWLSLSYGPAGDREMGEILDYFRYVSQIYAPRSEWTEGSGRRFFSHSYTNRDAGILLRWTPHKGGINEGKVSVDLQGSFFSLTDSKDRRDVLLLSLIHI